MNILFIHQNFPGQFKYLAPALAADPHNQVIAMRLDNPASTTIKQWQGLQIISYPVSRSSSTTIHPWLADFETKLIRAEACFNMAQQLHTQGFYPDVIIAHPGWGESFLLKQSWPQARLGIYCELFYHSEGFDSQFDPEFPEHSPTEYACKIQLKNINNLLHFEIADAGISPTHWQARSFPKRFQNKITVCHDGIDTEAIQPHARIRLNFTDALGNAYSLSRKDEIITFVNRNLEPYRGYHIFMRALPALLKQRPYAKILIVGGDDVSYGNPPKDGRTWKDIFIDEVRDQISLVDWQRVSFLGTVPYKYFIPLLQLSRVHIYLTYPFILSWSLLEAMSAGCAIVASDTAPLHEVIEHNTTGKLVNFFDPKQLVQTVCELLDHPEERQRLGHNARAFVCQHYDLQKVCLPNQIKWVKQLASVEL